MVTEQETAMSLPVLGNLTYKEIHAIEDGFYCGIHKLTESRYDKESHYWRTAWVLGDLYDRRYRDN